MKFGLCVSLFLAGCASAPESVTSALDTPGIDLIAVGSLPGSATDRSGDATPLENGVPANQLGGLGSGLAYAGWNRFIAVPDRGPNALPYDPTVDDTTAYKPRFHTLHMKLQPSAAGEALPFTLTPTVEWTTLMFTGPFWRPTYLTGKSNDFDHRFDLESIRVSNDGFTVFVSDEYGPYVYQFDRFTGQRLRSFTLPAEFAIAHPSARGDDEIANDTSGRVANKGMEGLAISPNGRTLFGAMQSPLIQDGGTDGKYTRMVVIDVRSGATREVAYELTNLGTDKKPKYPTISEVVAINDHELLVDERDGKGRGDGSVAVHKKLYRIDLTGAADVTGLSGQAALGDKAVAKTLFVNLVALFNAHGIASTDIPAKIEGLAFGPDLFVDGEIKHALWIANDNDFIPDNPNQWFVLSVDDAALPGYQPQLLWSLF